MGLVGSQACDLHPLHTAPEPVSTTLMNIMIRCLDREY